MLVGKAMPFMEYIIPAVVSRIDTSTGPGKTQAVEFLFPFIMSQDPFDQEHYLRVLAEKLDVDQGTLRSSIASIAQSQARRGRDQRRGSERQPEPQNTGATFLKRSENALDDYVLALLLQKPDAGEAARDFDAKYFTKIEARELFTLWLGCSKIDDLWNAVDESLRDYLASLSQRKLATLDLRESERALAQCMQRMETKYLQELQENLLTMDGADSVPSRSLEDQIAGVNARIKELFAQRN
jgi:DNA primase